MTVPELTPDQRLRTRMAILWQANDLRHLASGRSDPEDAERLRREADELIMLAEKFRG